eukprot:5408725-Pyramimonas_sp.AAC.1
MISTRSRGGARACGLHGIIWSFRSLRQPISHHSGCMVVLAAMGYGRAGRTVFEEIFGDVVRPLTKRADRLP